MNIRDIYLPSYSDMDLPHFPENKWYVLVDDSILAIYTRLEGHSCICPLPGFISRSGIGYIDRNTDRERAGQKRTDAVLSKYCMRLDLKNPACYPMVMTYGMPADTHIIKTVLFYEEICRGNACVIGHSNSLRCNIGLVIAGKEMDDNAVFLLPEDFDKADVTEIKKYGRFVGTKERKNTICNTLRNTDTREWRSVIAQDNDKHPFITDKMEYFSNDWYEIFIPQASRSIG